MYVKAIQKTFRTKQPIGKRGRMVFINWGQIVITQVVKRHKQNGKQKAGEIQRRIVQGTEAEADRLRLLSGGGKMINTAFIERLNATFRQRIACLARRSRAQVRQLDTLRCHMVLMGCVYNFCTPHRSLSEALYLSPRKRHWVRKTPAMAAGLTDHCWAIRELLTYKIRRHLS